MKQLYYTSCRAGKSVSGSSGFQVRAISREVPADQVRAAVRYAGYSLPSGMVPSEETAGKAPVRLALLETPELGRVLCHSVYVGQDPTTKRFGNFFSHLLLEVPPDLDTALAIRSWGSDFWRRADDDDGQTELPLVGQLPSANLLDETVLAAFLAHPSNQELMQFLLKAMLLSKPDDRIVVATQAQHLAVCIFGLTLALPRGLLEQFTFSTYENDPLLCHARLVGTSLDDSQQRELPSSCYSSGCAGYNTFSGKKTTLSGTAHYADYAVKTLASTEDQPKIDKFRRLVETLGVADGDTLELLYRCCRKDAVKLVSQEEVLRLLDRPEVAAWVLPHCPALLEQIVALASRDQAYYHAAVPRLVGLLNAKPQMRDQISGLSPRARNQLDAWVLLDAFVTFPRCDTDYLARVAEALDDQPQAVQKQVLATVREKLADALYSGAGFRDVRKELRAVLRNLGPYSAGGKRGLYDSLVNAYAKRSMYWREANLAYAMVAVACSSEFAGLIGRPQLHHVIELIKTHGGSRIMQVIKVRARQWDGDARRRWTKASGSIWPWILWIAAGLVVLALVVVAIDEAFLHQLNLFERLFPGSPEQ